MPPASTHARVAIAALLPLLIWGGYNASHGRLIASSKPVEIGVEHAAPASMTITRSAGKATSLTDVRNDSSIPLSVSLPDDWERGEVKGGSLSDLIGDGPNFGFRRWTLPSGMSVSFSASYAWNELTLHNADETALHVKIVTIDLEKNTRETESYLVMDEELTLELKK